jgi:hypothetical protein
VTSAYTGLNAINNKSAEYVGRNTSGVVRQSIDEEKEAVLKFFDMKRNVTGKQAYTLSILVSRADKKRAILDMISFINDLHSVSYSNPEKDISIQLSQVVPFPGTKFAVEHGSDYRMRSYSDYQMGFYSKERLANPNSKAVDFFYRNIKGEIYLLRGNSASLLLGLQNMVFAYEKAYKGKMETYMLPGNEWKRMMRLEKYAVNNPDIIKRQMQI